MKVNSVNLNTTNLIREKKTVFYSVRNNKPDSFERTATSEKTQNQTNPVNVREEFSNTINTLSSMHDKAKTAFENQLAEDGWSARLADKLSGLWGSKNRASLVKKDLIKYDNQIKALDAAAKKGNFKAKFRETFGVGYNKKEIENFEKI